MVLTRITGLWIAETSLSFRATLDRAVTMWDGKDVPEAVGAKHARHVAGRDRLFKQLAKR
jgi:hypothetical protein